MTDFTMPQGDTRTLRFQAKDETGVAVDITGVTIRWWLAKKPISPDPLIEKETGGAGITIPTPLEGRFEVELLDTDTADLYGTFYWEAEIDDGGIISTVASGNAIIRPALIRADAS